MPVVAFFPVTYSSSDFCSTTTFIGTVDAWMNVTGLPGSARAMPQWEMSSPSTRVLKKMISPLRMLRQPGC